MSHWGSVPGCCDSAPHCRSVPRPPPPPKQVVKCTGGTSGLVAMRSFGAVVGGSPRARTGRANSGLAHVQDTWNSVPQGLQARRRPPRADPRGIEGLPQRQRHIRDQHPAAAGSSRLAGGPRRDAGRHGGHRRLLEAGGAPRGAVEPRGDERTPPVSRRSGSLKLRAARPWRRRGGWEQP